MGEFKSRTAFIITDKRAKVFVENGNIKVRYIKNEEDIKAEERTFRPHEISQIITIGKVDITGDALNLIMKEKIELIFLNRNGKFISKLMPSTSKNVFLRIKQYKRLEDKEFILEFSKSIIRAKIKNQIVNLRKNASNRNFYNDRSNYEIIIRKLENLREMIMRADNIDKVRALEGQASKLYFKLFGRLIEPEWAVFRGRTKHPPRDNVNAVLSFLYSVILTRIIGAIESVGLDPYAGFFHKIHYGHPTLAFDLIEEFRVPLGDQVCTTLFNKKVLKPEDFRENLFNVNSDDYPLDNSDSEDEIEIIGDGVKGVLLNEEGVKKVVKNLSTKLTSERNYHNKLLGDKRVSFDKIILYQVESLKEVILNYPDVPMYAGITMR